MGIAEDSACKPPDCISLGEEGVLVKKDNQLVKITKASEDSICVPPDCVDIGNTNIISEKQDIAEDSACKPPDCVDIGDEYNLNIQTQNGETILKKVNIDAACHPPKCIDINGANLDMGDLVSESNPQPSPSPADLVSESNPQPMP